MNRDILIKIGCVAVGAAAGSSATYFILRKRLRMQAFAWADSEIASVKDTYKLLRKEPPYDDPKTAAKAYLERMDEMDSFVRDSVVVAEEAAEDLVDDVADELETAKEQLEEAKAARDIVDSEQYGEATTELHNIFDQARQRYEVEQSIARSNDEPFDELKSRDPRAPFIISFDDFFDDSNDFAKITITYFEGDNTLADDRESVIPDIPGVVGRENLQKFGVDAEDKNTVYIRNEKLEVDYEVIREEGSYAEIVHGIKEMEDSRDRRRVPRMRDDE